MTTISALKRRKKLRRAKNRCKQCGSNKDLTIDHIIPLSQGGTSESLNLQVLCRECNQAKGAKLPAELKRVLRVLEAVE